MLSGVFNECFYDTTLFTQQEAQLQQCSLNKRRRSAGRLDSVLESKRRRYNDYFYDDTDDGFNDDDDDDDENLVLETTPMHDCELIYDEQQQQQQVQQQQQQHEFRLALPTVRAAGFAAPAPAQAAAVAIKAVGVSSLKKGGNVSDTGFQKLRMSFRIVRDSIARISEMQRTGNFAPCAPGDDVILCSLESVVGHLGRLFRLPGNLVLGFILRFDGDCAAVEKYLRSCDEVAPWSQRQSQTPAKVSSPLSPLSPMLI